MVGVIRSTAQATKARSSTTDRVFLLVTCPTSTKQGSETETSAPLDMQAVRGQCYPKRQTRVTRWERQVPWQIEDKQDCQGSPRSFLYGEDGRGLAEIAFSPEGITNYHHHETIQAY